MNRSEFEVRLHACLDARRDPFDDPELVAWLDAHPGELDAVARLWSAIAVLQATDAVLQPHDAAVGANGSLVATAAATSRNPVAGAGPVHSPRSRRWPWLVLGAGLAGVAAAMVLAAIAPTHAAVPKAEVAAGRILSAVVEPIVPTLGLAPQVRATEVLVARPDVRVEVFTQWSVR